MDAGILGPLFVRVDSVSTVPSAPKLRSVLTTLIVHTGQVVPTSLLMAELWDEDPPRSDRTTLQTYILTLRKMFAAAMRRPTAEVARDVLITKASGYLFEIGSGDFDLLRYQALVASGREALSVGDDRGAVNKLGEALRIWRGPALVDVQRGRVMESKRRQLEESRLAVVEYLVDAQLRLGMYRDVLPSLVMLTSQNPLHEGLQAQYMRALHGSGRRAQALKVFRDLRDNLVDELGLDPGLEVQQLHQAILTSELR